MWLLNNSIKSVFSCCYGRWSNKCVTHSTGCSLEPRHTSTCVTDCTLSWPPDGTYWWRFEPKMSHLDSSLAPSDLLPLIFYPLFCSLACLSLSSQFPFHWNHFWLQWTVHRSAEGPHVSLRSCVLGFLRTWLSDTNHLLKVFAVSLIFDDESVFGNRNLVVCLKLVYWSNGQRLQFYNLRLTVQLLDFRSKHIQIQ